MPGKARKFAYELVAASFVVFMAGGCFYRAVPLVPAAVNQAVTGEADESIRVQVFRIEHPVLKPVVFDERNGLSPDEAAILAVAANPLLKAARDAKGLAHAQVIQAGILPNPRMSYSMEIPAGRDASGKVNAFALSADWDVNSLMVRDVRVAAAQAHRKSIDLEVAWQEWQVGEAAKLHVYRLLIAKKCLDVTEAAERVAKHLYAGVKKGLSLGLLASGQLLQARVVLHEARMRLLQARAEVKAEQVELNRVLGLPADRVVRLEKDAHLPVMEEIPPVQELVGNIEKVRLDLLALRYGYECREERLRAAIQSGFPRINIGFSGARDTDGLTTVGFDISISLPIFDRGQGRIAGERASRQQLFDEYAARLFEARTGIIKIYKGLGSTREQLQNIKSVVWHLQRLAERYRKAAGRGDLSVIDYYRVLLRLYQVNLEELALERRLVDLAVGLEIASGRYLFTGSETEQRAFKSDHHPETK